MATIEIPTKLISLLIVDDHHMVRDGIKTMLLNHESIFRFKITEAESGESAIQKAKYNFFELAIVDYQLPGLLGHQTIEQIKIHIPKMKFLALSNYDEISYVQNMISAGAMGYILKNIEPIQLVAAIKSVLENKAFYSSEVGVKLLHAEHIWKRTESIEKYGLTKREIEVLKMIALENTNEEISEILNIAKRTVDTHRQNLLHKLRAKNTAGLINAAYELKVLKK
jgi:DNA-binding NarL/FixJ family response regulator